MKILKNFIFNLKMIISVSELEKLIENPNIKILDCSSQFARKNNCSRIEFLKGHIPGAIYFDLDNFKNPESDLPYTMPT